MADSKGTFYKINTAAPQGRTGTDSPVYNHTLTPGATNDTYRIVKLPKGITLGDCWVQSSDGDTNATPTAVFSIEVTDGTTTKTLISLSTITQAGGFIRPTKVNATEDALGFTTTNGNFYIRIKWTTGAATAASTTFVIGLTLYGGYNYAAVTE